MNCRTPRSTTGLLVVQGCLLPALLQSALPNLPQAECLESLDGVNLMQTQKGRAALPSQNRSGTEDHSAAPDHQRATDSAIKDSADHGLLPQQNSTRVLLTQLLQSVTNTMPSDSAALSARFVVVLIVGLCFICCAICVTTNTIKSPSMAQPVHADELHARRHQLLAAIKASVPSKPYGPPVPVAEVHDAAGNQPAGERGLMAPMPQMQWPQVAHDQGQGQQITSGGGWPGRGRDVIVQHPLEGGRLGINLTNDDLVITGLLDSRAEAFGFHAGDRVTHINSVPVRSRADFVEALKAAMDNNHAYGQAVVVHVVNQAALAHPLHAAQESVQPHVTSASQDRPDLTGSWICDSGDSFTIEGGGESHEVQVHFVDGNHARGMLAPDGPDLQAKLRNARGKVTSHLRMGYDASLQCLDCAFRPEGSRISWNRVPITKAKRMLQNEGHAGFGIDVTMPASPPHQASPQPDAMSTQLPVFAAPEPDPFETQKHESSAVFQQPPSAGHQAPMPAAPQTQIGTSLPAPQELDSTHSQWLLSADPALARFGTSIPAVPQQTDSIHSQSPVFAESTHSPLTLQAQPGLIPVNQSPPQTLPVSPQPAPAQDLQQSALLPVYQSPAHISAPADLGAWHGSVPQATSEQHRASSMPPAGATVEKMAKDLFDRLDRNHDGAVNREEFEKGLRDLQQGLG